MDTGTILGEYMNIWDYIRIAVEIHSPSSTKSFGFRILRPSLLITPHISKDCESMMQVIILASTLNIL